MRDVQREAARQRANIWRRLHSTRWRWRAWQWREANRRDVAQAWEDGLLGRDWRWHWATWRERAAVEYDSVTGEQSDATWDHDHCQFCYYISFSDSGDFDLREGWTRTGNGGMPLASEQLEELSSKRARGELAPMRVKLDATTDYQYWVCPDCFERLREQFGWTVETAQ